MRGSARIGLLLALGAVSAPARAQQQHVEVHASDLVRVLAPMSGVRRHPLADSSGRIPVLVGLPGGVDAASVGLLPLGPGLATLRLAPGDVLAFEQAHPAWRLGVRPPMHTLLDRAVALNRTASVRAATGSDGAGAVVGVVDTGLDTAHADFLDEAGKTRVAWLLDMSRPPSGRHPEVEHAFGCDDPAQASCAVFDAADIDAAIASGGATPPPRDEVGHGTHVASIAAGDGGKAATAKYVGNAPGARLVVARVTHDATESVHDADIVTGARFVFDRAAVMGLPAVVNVSLGGDFGPHDGTSALERGLAALVGAAHPGRAIVVAAGNSGGLYRTEGGDLLGIHTEARVAEGESLVVPTVAPDAVSGGAVEGDVYVWITFRPGDDVSVGVEGPSGAWIPPIGRGRSAGYDGDGVTAGVFNGTVDDLSPLTGDTNGAIVAWSGKWPGRSTIALRLEGHGTAQIWLQATGEAAPGAWGIGQNFVRATKEGTINVPATHPDLIAVGCSLDRKSWTDAKGHSYPLDLFGSVTNPEPDTACYFSSAGPTATGAAKPELSAPGGLVIAAMSGQAAPRNGASSIFDPPDGLCGAGDPSCLVIDEAHALLSGTSMAAPQVTGAVALLFDATPTLTQAEVSRYLQAGVRHPAAGATVPFDFQMGAGLLDAEGTLAAALARTATGSPDPASSWLALSASYARPDPSWPIVGTVELRDAAKQVVDGVAAERLALVTTNAVVRAPLARVAAGLYRFTIAGAADTGEQMLELDVTLDGESLGVAGSSTSGRRSLPIAVDTWAARGDLVASGGCATTRGRAAGSSGALALALALAGLSLAARRARRRR